VDLLLLVSIFRKMPSTRVSRCDPEDQSQQEHQGAVSHHHPLSRPISAWQQLAAVHTKPCALNSSLILQPC
jgi:hypothetical protein